MNPGTHTNMMGRVARGFSLIEIIFVLLIVGILMMAAMPSGEERFDRKAISESLELFERYKRQVEAHYMLYGEFPMDNEAAGMPSPPLIIGNFNVSGELENGAIHIQLGNKIRPQLRGKIISLRPIFVPGEANVPISWICGNDTVPANMVAAGENKTNLESFRLPVACR
jgi:type IV pilus assembly protein PilA